MNFSNVIKGSKVFYYTSTHFDATLLVFLCIIHDNNGIPYFFGPFYHACTSLVVMVLRAFNMSSMTFLNKLW
jgi:hypothetical protein